MISEQHLCDQHIGPREADQRKVLGLRDILHSLRRSLLLGFIVCVRKGSPQTLLFQSATEKRESTKKEGPSPHPTILMSPCTCHPSTEEVDSGVLF